MQSCRVSKPYKHRHCVTWGSLTVFNMWLVFPDTVHKVLSFGHMWKEESNMRLSITVYSQCVKEMNWIESDCEKAACTSSNSRTSGLAPVVKKTSYPAQEDQKQKLSLSEWFHSAADELAVLRFNQSGSKSPHTEFYSGQGQLFKSYFSFSTWSGTHHLAKVRHEQDYAESRKPSQTQI